MTNKKRLNTEKNKAKTDVYVKKKQMSYLKMYKSIKNDEKVKVFHLSGNNEGKNYGNFKYIIQSTRQSQLFCALWHYQSDATIT